jgi:hypothetical protein
MHLDGNSTCGGVAAAVAAQLMVVLAMPESGLSTPAEL